MARRIEHIYLEARGDPRLLREQFSHLGHVWSWGASTVRDPDVRWFELRPRFRGWSLTTLREHLRHPRISLDACVEYVQMVPPGGGAVEARQLPLTSLREYSFLRVHAEALRSLVEEASTIRWELKELSVDELLNSFQFDFDRKNDKKLDYLVRRYERGNKFPPVMVLHTENGYEILDGHHRIAALHEVHQKKVLAIVGKVGV